jgi:putative membrane protein insertion efficiency factor
MKKILLLLFQGYRKYIYTIRQPCCRFIPPCSAYALEAVEKYGALRGGLMALWRVLRCNPFCKGGFDPVP